MMLWHHNARVNSHQRWKQTRFRVCFHLWCKLTSTTNVTEWQVSWNSIGSAMILQNSRKAAHTLRVHISKGQAIMTTSIWRHANWTQTEHPRCETNGHKCSSLSDCTTASIRQTLSDVTYYCNHKYVQLWVVTLLFLNCNDKHLFFSDMNKTNWFWTSELK